MVVFAVRCVKGMVRGLGNGPRTPEHAEGVGGDDPINSPCLFLRV